MAECGPESEIEARLVKRMAIAFWKGERAERIEVALFDAAPKLRPPQAGFEWEEADPLTTFDLKRFNAVRGYQAQQGRELSRCLKELRLLRREPLDGMHGRTREHVTERTRDARPSPPTTTSPSLATRAVSIATRWRGTNPRRASRQRRHPGVHRCRSRGAARRQGCQSTPLRPARPAPMPVLAPPAAAPGPSPRCAGGGEVGEVALHQRRIAEPAQPPLGRDGEAGIQLGTAGP